MKSDMPFSVMLTLAMLSSDRGTVDRLANRCFAEIGNELMKVVNSYDVSDLPFVVAAMRITADSLMPVMGESGRRLAEKMTSATTIITVDADEMRRQAGGNDDGGTEE